MKAQILSQILQNMDWSLGESCGAQDVTFGVFYECMEWATELWRRWGSIYTQDSNSSRWSKDSWTNLVKDRTSLVEFELWL
jgi:hypothetical protein